MCMTNLQEIEKAIDSLPRAKFLKLLRHIRGRHSEEWDLQIEQDARNGNLQKFYERLKKEDQGEPEVPLDAFLDNKELS